MFTFQEMHPSRYTRTECHIALRNFLRDISGMGVSGKELGDHQGGWKSLYWDCNPSFSCIMSATIFKKITSRKRLLSDQEEEDTSQPEPQGEGNTHDPGRETGLCEVSESESVGDPEREEKL